MPGEAEAPTVVRSSGEDLKRLYLEHELKLSEMVRRHIGNRLAARLHPEDVLQGAFIRAERRRDHLPPDPKYRYSWLYSIVREELFDQIRLAMADKRALDREVPLPEDSRVQVVMGLTQSQTSPSGRASRREDAELARRAMQELKDLNAGDFEIVTMRIFDDLGFGEIGQILGEKENSVTKRYHRALHKLLLLVNRIRRPDPERSGP